jgi:hypothetical protein
MKHPKGGLRKLHSARNLDRFDHGLPSQAYIGRWSEGVLAVSDDGLRHLALPSRRSATSRQAVVSSPARIRKLPGHVTKRPFVCDAVLSIFRRRNPYQPPLPALFAVTASIVEKPFHAFHFRTLNRRLRSDSHGG